MIKKSILVVVITFLVLPIALYYDYSNSFGILVRKYPMKKDAEITNGIKVKIQNYRKRVGFGQGLSAEINKEYININVASPISFFYSRVSIPWKSVTFCGQTYWSPEKDTDIWLGEVGIEITIPNDDGFYLDFCRDQGVEILKRGDYMKVVYSAYEK